MFCAAQEIQRPATKSTSTTGLPVPPLPVIILLALKQPSAERVLAPTHVLILA